MNSFHKFTLGKFECAVYEDTFIDIDLRKVFTQLDPDVLLKNIKQTGGSDYAYQVGFNCLSIEQNGIRVLVDSGKGTNNLIENMLANGITPDDVDYLVITHSDFDHVGGLHLFNNSKIIFPEKSFALWTNEASRKKLIGEYEQAFSKFMPKEIVSKGVAFRSQYGKEFLPSIKERITFVESEEEFLPGMKMIYAPGHRTDHFAVEFSSGSKTLLHVVDAFRHPIQVLNPSWYCKFDSYPEILKQTIQMLVSRAKEKDALIFGSHFMFPGLLNVDDELALKEHHVDN